MLSKVILDIDTQLEIEEERKRKISAGKIGGACWRMKYLEWKIWKNYRVAIYKDKLVSKIGDKKDHWKRDCQGI